MGFRFLDLTVSELRDRLSRMIVREILARPRPPRLAIELSGRMGVGTGLPTW